MAKTKGSTIEEKKYLAKILFAREHLDQKETALRVKVSEKTIGKWVKEGNWKDLRRRLLITKEQELSNFYEQLENLNRVIKSSDAKHPDSKQSDIQIKLTAAIRNLETDLGIAELVDSGMKFLKYVQEVGSPDQLKDFAELWNSFVQASIKK